MNKIILIGRLTRDPEPRYATEGVAVTRFTLAIDRPFKTAAGEREADFIDIITWRKLAEIVANNLGKGRLVAVEGRLEIRSYTDNDGVRRKAAQVVADRVQFLDYAKDRQPEQQGDAYEPPNSFATDISFSDDDVPF